MRKKKRKKEMEKGNKRGKRERRKGREDLSPIQEEELQTALWETFPLKVLLGIPFNPFYLGVGDEEKGAKYTVILPWVAALWQENISKKSRTYYFNCVKK